MKTMMLIAAAVMSTGRAPVAMAQPLAEAPHTTCSRNDRPCNQEYRPSNYSRIEARGHRDQAAHAKVPAVSDRMLNDRQLYWGYAARNPVTKNHQH